MDPLGLALENYDVTGAGASRTTRCPSTRRASSMTGRTSAVRPVCAQRS
ncbi:MAG: hypothetical protein ACLGHP_11840 [Vicinamibacteria bacterium]